MGEDDDTLENPYLITRIVLRESPDVEYPVRVEFLSEKHFNIVLQYVKEYHVPRFYLWKLFRLSEEGLSEYLKAVLDWIKEGTSIVAIHNKTEKVLGFIIGSLWEISNWPRELENLRLKFVTKEANAVLGFGHSFHKMIDLFLVHNANFVYNMHMWVITDLKGYSFLTYELLKSLIHMCDIVGVKVISTIATIENQKIFAEYIGFHVSAKTYYLEYFKEYKLSRKILRKEYFGYFLTFSICGEERKRLDASSYKILLLPSLIKRKTMRKNKRYWQDIHWSNYPPKLKHLKPNNVLI